MDAAGALLSATLMFALIAPFENIFGLPEKVAYTLGAIALGFFAFSSSSAIRPIQNRRPHLRAIAISNLIYCIITLSLCIAFWDPLTRYGRLYLLAEACVIAALVTFELRIARNPSRTQESPQSAQ